MSMDKSIEHGKEKRRKYRGAKAIDGTCCNHGSCSSCREARLRPNKKRLAQSQFECEDCFDTGCTCGGIGYSCNGCCHCATARELRNQS